MLELLLLFLRVYTVLSLEFSVFLPWALSISYDWMGASRGALLLRLILTNASFLAFSEKSTRLSARRLVLFSIKAPLLPINSMYPTRICLICTNVVQFLPLLSPRLCLGAPASSSADAADPLAGVVSSISVTLNVRSFLVGLC